MNSSDKPLSLGTWPPPAPPGHPAWRATHCLIAMFPDAASLGTNVFTSLSLTTSIGACSPKPPPPSRALNRACASGASRLKPMPSISTTSPGMNARCAFRMPVICTVGGGTHASETDGPYTVDIAMATGTRNVRRFKVCMAAPLATPVPYPSSEPPRAVCDVRSADVRRRTDIRTCFLTRTCRTQWHGP